MPANAQRLEVINGWKEIANYLGKGIRTVQRYERVLGLPVRRPAGRPASSVIATKAEIDAWVNARPIREAFSLRPRPLDDAGTGETLALHRAQLTQLREEAARLRNEITASREALRRSIELLHESLRVTVAEAPPLFSSSRPTADLLAFDLKKKVN